MWNLLKKKRKILAILAAVSALILMPVMAEAGSVVEGKTLLLAYGYDGYLSELSNGLSFYLLEDGDPKYRTDTIYVMTSYSENLEDAGSIEAYTTGGYMGDLYHVNSDRNAGISILAYEDYSSVFPYAYPMEAADALQEYNEKDKVYISGFAWGSVYTTVIEEGLGAEDLVSMSLSNAFTIEEQISNTADVGGLTFYELEESYGETILGAPLLNSGNYLAGIVVKTGEHSEYLSIDGIVNCLYETHVNKPYFLIPMAVLALAAAFSAIAYFAKTSQRAAQGLDEFELDTDGTPGGNVPGMQGIAVGRGGAFDGQSFSLDKSLVFGRDGTRCNVVYPGETRGISSLHCSLEKSAGKVYLTDLGSSYGTFLGDGTKLAANVKHELKSGDTFYLAVPLHTFEIR